MNDALAESEIVGDWHTRVEPQFICPGGPMPDDECDCGFVGRWDYRQVYTWLDVPGHRRSARMIRRDMADGWPARPKDEGYWCVAGYDERCPGCGDMERFDSDANQVAVLISAEGRRRRAEILRDHAAKLDAQTGWTPDDPFDAALAMPLPQPGGLRLVSDSAGD